METQTLVIITGAIAAGFVQGLTGFGFGLVAMSIWAWTIDPRLAAAMLPAPRKAMLGMGKRLDAKRRPAGASCGVKIKLCLRSEIQNQRGFADGCVIPVAL